MTIDQRGDRFRGRAKVRNGAGEEVRITEYADSAEEVITAVKAKAQLVWGGLFAEVTRASTVEQLAQLWLATVADLKRQLAVAENDLARASVADTRGASRTVREEQ
ncbi:hypothetical protein [Microbacterium sp. Marseille-Q6965]|uniref:hypothetical protein n=1 Tax=Microbacterium sp. Marseille-Q6965 TaxID=2965072 RepID=UPI0021B7E254|nr:hypothetical protein [Microbacterium sp. Marseille-Q6965]